jgi:ABC-2 type transport system permease protein
VIGVELRKQVLRPRTVATIAALAGFGLALVIALDLTGAGRPEPVGDLPLVLVPRTSGFTVPMIALSSTMKFFLPLAVAIFAGEAVAGEAAWGSLRQALAGGTSRARFLAAKGLVAALLSLAAVLVVPLAALVAGVVAYGWHPLAVSNGAAGLIQASPAVFQAGGTLLRLALATAYVAAGMASIFSFAFFLSTATNHALVAVAGGVGLTIISRVFNADYLPGVAVVDAYAPNNNVDLWVYLFLRPQQTAGMAVFLGLQAAYTVIFLGLSWWWFRRRDVLT